MDLSILYKDFFLFQLNFLQLKTFFESYLNNPKFSLIKNTFNKCKLCIRLYNYSVNFLYYYA